MSRCQINVEPEEIKNNYWDDWVLSSGGASSEHHWNVCMKWILCVRKRGREDCDNNGCRRCSGDTYDALRICRAEKGTEIGLWDDSDAGVYKDDAVKILMLKDFKNEDPFCRGDYLKIEDLERSETTEYYKMTFYKHKGGKGNLNGKVSSVSLQFWNRQWDF